MILSKSVTIKHWLIKFLKCFTFRKQHTEVPEMRKLFSSEDLNTFVTSNSRNRQNDYVIKKIQRDNYISHFFFLFSRCNYCKGQIPKEVSQ